MTSYVSPVAFTTVAQSIPPNVFADMDRKVAAAVADGADVIDLAKGNPDAFPADFIREVAKKAVDDPANARYSPFDGKPSFLQAAEQWYRNTYGVEVDWKTQLFAVEGAVDGLAALFAVLVSPGDAVAYADPYYPSYHCMTVMSRAEEVLLPSLPERGFLPDLDAVPAQVWNRVKVLVLNYPNNPTGAIMTREDLLAIADFAQEHDLIVISDEIYGDLTYGGEAHICFSSLPHMQERTLLLNGFSKAYAMTGWRIGYALGAPEIIAAMTKIHQYTMLCAPITAQLAAIEALRHGEKYMKKMVAEYDRRRRLIYEGFMKMGLNCFEPKGAFYIFPDITSTGYTSEEFAEKLLEAEHVALVPGSAFGDCGEGHVRCSYATSVDKISEALARIENFVRHHKKA